MGHLAIVRALPLDGSGDRRGSFARNGQICGAHAGAA
jgi:hypothetical protein